MRGHEHLLVMRRSGKAPAHITLLAAPGKAWPWWLYPEQQPYPEVQVEPNDVPELLDLRFVVGLPVVVTCTDDVPRMKRLVLAAEAAGARPVVGFCHRHLGGDRIETLDSVCTTLEDQSWRS